MPRNVFENLRAINAGYVDQNVGTNFNELNQAAATLDERYRQNLNAANKAALVASQERYLAGDQGLKDEIVNQVGSRIDEIAKSDQNFENSTASVMQLAKDFYTDPRRLAATENFQRVEEAKALRNKLGANALNFGDNPDTFTTLGEDGKPRRFNAAIEERADYSRKMQELLGRVADDGYTIGPTGQKIKFDEYERYLIKSGQVNKIDKTKLNNLVEGLLPVYKSTGEGKQDIRRLTNIEGMQEAPVTIKDGKIVRKTTNIDEDIRNRFRSLAAPQEFSKSSMRWDDFGIPVGSTKVQPGGVYTPTNPGSVTDNTSFSPVTVTPPSEYTYQEADGSTYQYIDNETKQPLSKQDNPLTKGGFSFLDPKFVEDFNKRYTKVPIDKNNTSVLQQSMNNVLENLPKGMVKYNGLEHYTESVKEASKNHAKITPTGNVIAPDQAAQYDDMITRQAVSSPLYFKEGRKPVQGLEGLAKEIGTSPSNIKFKAVNIFYDSPRADLPGGYIEAKIDVEDSKVGSHPTSVFIPLNDQSVALAEPIDHLYKNSFYQGRDTYSKTNPFVPRPGGKPMVNPATGEILTFYTVTYALPKEQQQAGKPGYKTMVFPGTIAPNGSNGQDITWSDQPMSIGEWKQLMIGATAPMFKNALNSGQTYNTTDFKNQGIDY